MYWECINKLISRPILADSKYMIKLKCKSKTIFFLNWTPLLQDRGQCFVTPVFFNLLNLGTKNESTFGNYSVVDQKLDFSFLEGQIQLQNSALKITHKSIKIINFSSEAKIRNFLFNLIVWDFT